MANPPSGEPVCEDNSRWQNLPWVYLTYAERNAWGELGWSQPWWDFAWGVSTSPETATGRCFGTFVIGESGMDTCLVGELAVTYEDCRNASATYQTEFPGDLLPLGRPVNDPQGTPGCHIQDRVGFQFNEAQITGRNPGYSPVCKFNATLFGNGCPQTTTTAAPTLPNNLQFSNTIPAGVLTCYQDLNRDQQDAVRLLGYSISSWHSCMDPSWNPPDCPWPDDIPRPEAPCLERSDYLANKYNISLPWRDLTYRAKAALVDLGWDPNGAQWTAVDTPESYAKPFDGQPPPTGLSRQEREAARFLGYTADVWHGCQAESECITRLQRLEGRMTSWSWRTMPRGIRQRLQILGWTEEFWGEGELPALYRSKWDDLRHPEKVAARLVGYTKDTWEGCPMAGCVVRYNYILAKYEGVSWGAMKLAQQNAWVLLEHSEELWNNGGMMRTRLMSKRWEELTPEQRRQARYLGHDKGTWQGCNLAWSDGTVNATSYVPVFGGPDRTVRVRMTIEAPFSEVSGNVYGQQVSSLPTSFIMVFERSVGRALFCGNPDFKNYSAGAAFGPSGEPLCKLPDEFERQRRRVRVVSVMEGSIIVDFIIVKNQTESEQTAFELYTALKRQLESFASPIGQDVEFGKYAAKATVEEIPLSDLDPQQRERALVFERMRGKYDEGNACNLQKDARTGAIRCPTAAAPRRSASAGLLGMCVLAALLHSLAGIPQATQQC